MIIIGVRRMYRICTLGRGGNHSRPWRK